MLSRAHTACAVVVLIIAELVLVAPSTAQGSAASAVTIATQPAQTRPLPLLASDATVSLTPAAGMQSFALGITHTQYSADASGDPTSVATARRLLDANQILQNQHIMGWGATNPEPAPGVFDWSSLDARMALIRSTGGIPVITLCCAPDWMKGGVPGHTDWSRLTVAPSANHYADFAELARQVALRYPEVRTYQVWNEMKGFWNARLNRWDVEAYTDLYNAVYDALKEVNPAIRVGGPYVVMSSTATTTGPVSGPWGSIDPRALDVVTYWLAHKHGADFIAIDGATTTMEGRLVTDPFTANGKFAAVDTWLRSKTKLPIWWSEVYVQPPGTSWSQQQQAAVFSAAVAELVRSGAAAALLWAPQAETPTGRVWLWTDTRPRGGGTPSVMYQPYEATVSMLSRKAPRVVASSSVDRLVVVSTGTNVLLVNGTGHALIVSLGTRRLALRQDEVVVTSSSP